MRQTHRKKSDFFKESWISKTENVGTRTIRTVFLKTQR
ncbi:hypothetical protein LEP1GSC082_1539 [Leptospira kirschneri str. H2]|nr:hypothetical protein LEP1GSC082_1539 [Leptospira kirschneri str. H2]